MVAHGRQIADGRPLMICTGSQCPASFREEARLSSRRSLARRPTLRPTLDESRPGHTAVVVDRHPWIASNPIQYTIVAATLPSFSRH